MIAAEAVLAGAGALFVALGLWRRRDARHATQARIWLRVGLIFCVVAAWLAWRG